MHIPWGDVQLFLAIAETGSLSAAAKRLLVTQPTVSRRLAELEDKIGEPLFERSVEGTSLTSFGERMIAPARRMAEEAGELERLASGAESTPRGVVRITAAPGVAFDLVAPFAAHVREKLPEIRLEVISTIDYVDLARREADLALRFDRPPQRDLVALATVVHPVRPYATKAYAAKLPRRYGIADVGWIGWPPALAHLPPNPQLAARIPDFAPVFASDDFLVQLRAAEAGVGAIFLGRGRSKRALPTPLVELDLDMGKLSATTYLVCPKSALGIARVRAVAELLVAEIEKTGSRSVEDRGSLAG
jgi:DNA-binding transcriptional LysR family regulator